MRPPTAADPYPFAGTQLPCLVGGEFIRTRDAFQNLSPVDGTTLCTVSEADAVLVDRAVQAARAALQGPWGRTSLPERCALLRKVAERIEARFTEFVSAKIADTGKTLAQASALDIPRGA
ncbi:MAG TPA: aldehyde dehydrogenase family protein, partial [Steroidobacteraceae bacterium]|nr:aldehyde dehydrogenase family protein [Steroidobacteraceae bacterium]